MLPFADCTASSRMRPRMLPTSPRAPSAVCTMLVAAFELRSATTYDRIWVFIRSLIARPAASSAAVLIRIPLDSLAKLDWRAPLVRVRFCCACSEEMLVTMLKLTVGLLQRKRCSWMNGRYKDEGTGSRGSQTVCPEG